MSMKVDRALSMWKTAYWIGVTHYVTIIFLIYVWLQGWFLVFWIWLFFYILAGIGKGLFMRELVKIILEKE